MFAFFFQWMIKKRTSSSYFMEKEEEDGLRKRCKKMQHQIHDSRHFMHVWKHFISTNIRELLFIYTYILFALKFVLLCLNSNVASSVTCIVDVSMHENINNRMRAEIWMWIVPPKTPFIDIIRFCFRRCRVIQPVHKSILQHLLLKPSTERWRESERVRERESKAKNL